MSMESTYIKKYIILKKDYTNISEISPKGHGKLEVRGNRGRLSLNLENCQWDRDYRVYFLKDRGNKVEDLDLGRIIADERGRVRINLDLNLRDLESKGFPVDKIDAILIKRNGDILLGGYIDEDNKVIEKFLKGEIPQESNKQAEEIKDKIDKVEDISALELVNEVEVVDKIEDTSVVEVASEPKIIDELEDIATVELVDESEIIDGVEDIPIAEIASEPNIIDELEDIAMVELANESGIIDKTENISMIEEVEEHPNYQSVEYTRRLNQKEQMHNYILSILEYFPYIQPFKIELYGYNWWRIEYGNISSQTGFLPYYNYLMGADYKYPFLNNPTTCFDLIMKYGHYLFGMYKEGKETKYYVYGVPGKFIEEEYPFKGITGFNTWYESIEGIGYWLLYIDPMTDEIIYPLNPMIPAY